MLTTKKTLSVRDVSRICNVSEEIVKGWLDDKLLHCYGIPGTGRLCIPDVQLQIFLDGPHGQGIVVLEEQPRAVFLLVGFDEETQNALESWVNICLQIEYVTGDLEAVKDFAISVLPDYMVIDFRMGIEQAMAVASQMNQEFGFVHLIALIGNDDLAEEFDRSMFNDIVLRLPNEDIRKCIRQMLRHVK